MKKFNKQRYTKLVKVATRQKRNVSILQVLLIVNTYKVYCMNQIRVYINFVKWGA